MPRNRRNLVVDADIVSSAGTTKSTNPRSSLCRTFLEVIRERGYAVVLSPALSTEWKKHMSGFTMTWRVKLESTGRVIRVKDDDLPDLASILSECVCSQAGDNRAGIMRKDIHLIETALAPAADKVVVSADNRVLRHLLSHTQCDPRIGIVVWVSATIEEHQCLEWLRAGAKNERARQLRRQAAESS